MGVDDHEDAGRYEPDGDGLDHGPGGASAAAQTGDERVDEALTRLERLDRVPVADHVEIFDDVHQRLQNVLAAIDQDEQRPPVPPRP